MVDIVNESKTNRNVDIQPISGEENTGQSGSNAYAINEGDIFSCNLPTSQRLDSDVYDMMSKLSQGSNSATMANNLNIIPKTELIIENQIPLKNFALHNSDASNHDLTEQNEYLLSVSPERLFNNDIDQTDEEGYTSLYKAASRGQLSKVRNLVESGVDPNTENEDGRRALHVAAEEGHTAIVKLLVKQGADVDAECDLGQTALHTAVHNNKNLSALFLIFNGADIYKRDNHGRTPLHMAAAAGNIHIFENIGDETCDINVEDDMGLTVLHHAVRNGNSNIVNYLLKKGAEETPYGGDSLLFASASFGNLDLVKLFISRGGNVNEENSIGQNPLHVAASKGYLDITKCLVQEGCDMNNGDHEDFTPIHGAVLNGHSDVLDYLITQGSEITKYDGKSVLQLAAIHGHLDILQYFMKMGADVSELDDSGQTPLHLAAGRGHLDVVKYLIEQGSKIDKQDHRGYSPLHIAALSGHLDIVRFFMNRISLHLAASDDDLDNVQYLVQQGFDINSCDEKGWTPLEYAIQNNNCEVIDYLLKKGAEGDQCKEKSPLYMASRLGHLDAVNVMISRRISVNAETLRGQIPLHAAAATGRIEVVKTLVQNGSDLNKTDIDGWTPLHAAVQNGHLEVVRYLMWKGAIDIEYRGMTSLYIAAQSGHLDIVKHLNHGTANVNDEDNLGRIPLHGAVMKGDIELVHYLVEQGSDVNKGDINGCTPMHIALQNGNLFIVQYLIEKDAKLTKCEGMTPLYIASLEGHLEIVDLFLSYGADVNEENRSGRIPLHAAAANGSPEIVQKPINHGANVNKMADSGWTPLHEAVHSGRSDNAQYLISHGATKTRFEGMTALYIAAQHGHTDLMTYFVTTGCDVNEGTTSGKTPLLAACYNGDMDSVEMLVIESACINQADRNKWTPLHAAAQEGHLPVVTYLIENGADTNAKDTDGMTPLQAADDAGHEDVKQFLSRFRVGVQDERHKDTDKTDGMTPLQAAVDAGQDGQQFIIRFRAEKDNEQHDGTEKSLRSDRSCPQNLWRTDPDRLSRHIKTTIRPTRESCVSKPMTQLHGGEVPATNDLRVTSMTNENDPVDPKLEIKNPWRVKFDTLIGHIKKTSRSVRDFCISKQKTQLHGSDIHATDGLAVIRMTNKKDEVDCKLGIKNPWRVKFDTLIGHIKKTSRSVRVFCVSKPNTQLYGGEVPDTDDLRVTRMTNENDAVDPKLEIKNPWRTNPDRSSRHIKQTIRPTRESCVSRPKTQLHGGEVPATDDLRVTSMTNEKNAVDLKLGIKNERRINENCFSILALLHRVILALALFFACCPILVAGNLRLPEPVTLEAGTRGVITFFLERPTSTLQFSLFYTIQFESKRRPFCIDGQYDIDGFKDPAQVSRFTTTVADKDTSACVNMTIDNVDTLDEDRYIFIGVWHSGEDVLYDTQKKEVFVQRPPGRADCFITLSDSEYPYEVHCWAKTGSMPTTLTCYQNERYLVMVHNITDNGHTTRAIFLLHDTTRFSCCSHDITSTVDAATCNDFEWPPGYSGIPSSEKSTRSRSAGEQSNRPTDPTFLTNITSDVGSGACRSIIPSQWHFLYLLMYLHAFVIMC